MKRHFFFLPRHSRASYVKLIEANVSIESAPSGPLAVEPVQVRDADTFSAFKIKAFLFDIIYSQ